MAVKNYGIRDQWTNLDKLNNVDIKSVDGVIESVKINGEEAGGGGGSSDFSTAEVTVVNNTGTETARGLLMTIIDERTNMLTVYGLPSGIYTVPIFKGALNTAYLGDETVIVSGNATEDDGDIIITGDCTITIS